MLGYCRWTLCDPRSRLTVTLSENCSLLGTDNVRGQASIFSLQREDIVYIMARFLPKNAVLWLVRQGSSHFCFTLTVVIIRQNCLLLLNLDQQSISYEEVGCFKDNQVDPRPLPELLADLTGEVDWFDVSKVIRKCARLASEKGYTVFGLQLFGQCRSGKDAAETYNSDGDSTGCSSGLGGRGENLVFKILPQSRFSFQLVRARNAAL